MKYLRLIGKMSIVTPWRTCSGKQLSRSYSNQNQTEDFGGLKFYNVVGNQERIFVGEKKVYYKETAEGQAGSEQTEFFLSH